MKIRKINKQELYKLTDDDNQIIAVFDTKKEAKQYIKQGGKINAKNLKAVLNNSYNKKPKEKQIDGLTMDKSLSGRRVQTYIDNDTGEVYFVNRGTQGFHDVITDMKLFFTPTSKLKNLKRFKYADEMLKKVDEKYGPENVSVLGHSLGAKIAEVIGKNRNKNIITYNKPVLPLENIEDKKNQIDIKTTRDPVSILDIPDENDIVIQSKSLNPIYEHSLQALEDYLDDGVVIGSGLKKIKKKKNTKK